jgi:hypothetical protein
VIGGANAGARNVISGNKEYGVYVGATNTSGTLIQGNHIGTDASGAAALPNGDGVGVFEGTHGVTIGGANAAARNVISGSLNTGIWLSGVGVNNNTVSGNYVGLNATGTAAVPNRSGMYVLDGAQSNVITGNVFSGNVAEGLRLAGVGVSGNVVQGNFCGTDAAGTSSIPNGFAGMALYNGAAGNTIGGVTAAARNILSGNSSLGLATSGVSNNVVQGNFIGTDVSGSAAVANRFAGVYLAGGAQNNLFGGAAAGAGNVVSGNLSFGILVADPATSGNLIQGNFIGTRADGTNALGNGFSGVIAYGGAHGNVLGLALDGSGAGNRVAFSGSDGIRLEDTNTLGNAIRGNAVWSNGRLGIDLAGGAEDFYGVTANDPGDGDSGPNNLQNYPVITQASVSGGMTTIAGTLNSTLGRSFLLDFYRNASPDPSGFGEGENYVGSAGVTTATSSDASYTLVASGNFANQYFTATATDMTAGDTSEFSRAVPATNGPAPTVLVGPFVWNGSGFTFSVTLQTNLAYRIQATTNLAANPIPWIDLTNFTATNSPLQFSDRFATNYRMRFYRVVSP